MALGSKKHLVLLTDCLEDPAAGGAERNIYELYTRLDPEKFRVTIVSMDCDHTGSEKFAQAINDTIHTFKVKRIYGLSGLFLGLKFKKFLKENKVDILQTYHFGSDIWGAFWGRQAGVSAIISSRRDMGFWRGKKHIRLYRMVNDWVHKIIVVSNEVKRIVQQEEKVASEKVEVIFNGVNLDNKGTGKVNDALKLDLDLRDDDIIILHVGNLKPVKGHEYLIKAFAELAKVEHNVKLLLVGEDELKGAMNALAEDLKVANKIRFLGKRNDVQDLLPLADVCVMPSLSEGMSNAVLEYMAAGKPVVATAVGGNLDNVVEGETGYLVPPKDVQSLSQALKKVVENQELRRDMGRAARKRIEEVFAVDSMIKKYEDLYERLVS